MEALILMVAGAVLVVISFLAERLNDGAVIVTGTVVASRRTVEYFNEGDNEKKSLLEESFDVFFREPRGNSRLVTVYRPIVRFTYLGDTREAVVDEREFVKPPLNVSMEIAFFPEDLAHAWRPAKQALWGDFSLVVGIIFIILGVFLCLGVPLPFEISLEQVKDLL